MTITNNSLGRLTFGPSPIVTNGLILYLDAASRRSYSGGTTWKDLSGNGNDFTIYGEVVHNDKHFNLNGTTSQYVQANPFPHPTNDYTIELYERINTFNLTPLYSYAVTSNSNEGLLYIPSNTNGIIYVYGPSSGRSTGYSISVSSFHQIVRTRSYTAGTEKLYINGTLVATETQAVGETTEAGGSFNIGQEQDSVGGGFRDTQTLNGDISLVRVYNRVLSAQEINDSYEDIKVRFE